MTRDIEFRLIGHASADGQLLAADAVGLITAFKEVTYRLTRFVAERPTLGRADAVLERLATVRVALRSGSTRVVFAIGDEDALVDPLAEQVDEAFWSIFTGMSMNERPADLSDTVVDAVDKLIAALSNAAPQVEVQVANHDVRVLAMPEVSRTPWQRSSPQPTEPAVLHGLLEMVDLRTSRFRLRDAAGNGIDLIDVAEARSAAALVGQNVRVEGNLQIADGGQRHRMVSPHVMGAEAIETRLGLRPQPSISDLLIQARSAPSYPPPLNLSDEELDDFLAVVRGG